MTHWTLLFAGLAANAPAPPPAAAPTTVVFVAELPAPGARAAVLRRSGGRGDVILLPQSRASAEDLAAALALLADARGRDGPAPFPRDAVLVVKSLQLSQPLDAARRQRLEAQLSRLRSAPPRLVAGLGSVPAIEVTVDQPR